MGYRNPAAVRDKFHACPRRALIVTTVVHESRAVKSHIVDVEMLVGENGGIYEFGRFPDPAGDWLIVHALSAQGNSDAGLVASKAHQEFGRFHAQMFVGVAGSLKEDICIGSVIVGDYVYNAHSAKVEDHETLARSHSLPAARELLTAAQALIYTGEWINLIRPPVDTLLPATSDYPADCKFPPEGVIKAIASGEEVVAGIRSPRAKWFRSHLNDAGAVEMEGWGVMNAAHHENTPAIVVRGISDMCAGKDHVKDKLHQPIASAHAAAFAFSILSFRSKASPEDGIDKIVEEALESVDLPPKERRVEFILNFQGSKEEWSEKRIDDVLQKLKQVMNDENMNLLRIESGSVRLVVSVREGDLSSMDLTKLRNAAVAEGAVLLGATSVAKAQEADVAKVALRAASSDLLAWDKTLPNGGWIDRPEREIIESRFGLEASSTVLLGAPGSGKSALLSKIAGDLLATNAALFALKADFLSTEVRTEADLQRELQLPAPPSELILCLATLQPVFVFIDQLDALANQVDLRSDRLNVILNLVRRVGGATNVHVLLSARTFEFNHDVRLRAVEAEAVTLTLPPWHEVKERLGSVGINPDTWPEKARDVVRIPQALKTYLELVGAGRTEPFGTYQAMLEQLWRDRIASASDSESLIPLVSHLASIMAEEEALWLAASRFDDRLRSLERLEALGFVVRSENNLSVAFAHQTIFDYVLARTFVRTAGLLSTYVLDRQDSLFVRAKMWSTLNYLREAESRAYERELLAIWNTVALRRHLRLLLIEFLGQVSQPLEVEKICMGAVMASSDLRVLGLKAIGSSQGWFRHFSNSAIREAMLGTDAEMIQAVRILATNWTANTERVLSLVRECWLPYPNRDISLWSVLYECPFWSVDIVDIAVTVLRRGSISIGQVEHIISQVAVTQPEIALQLVRAKLDTLLGNARSVPEAPPFPESGTEDEQTAWYIEHRRARTFEELLETTNWGDLPAIAEAVPHEYLQHLWSWYISVFSEILLRTSRRQTEYVYPGQLFLEIDLVPSDRRASRDKPVLDALQTAIEGLAERTPVAFLEWARENSALEILAVQQLIARGFTLGGAQLSSNALDWLLDDRRRFQLGTRYGHRHTTEDLVRATSSYWSREEVRRFERAILSYRPPIPVHVKEAEQRRLFADMVRATRKDLLQAVDSTELSPESRELIVVERRALGDRFERSVGETEGGWIGSPMEADAMAKSKDRDILKIFNEIPDKRSWEHPTDWMRGGNIQLSRAFSEFARNSPERALRIMEYFEPQRQERAAGYALDAMADDHANDSRIVDALVDLEGRGFQSEEFRESASRAIEKIADRKTSIPSEVVVILKEWLSIAPQEGPDGTTDELAIDTDEVGSREGSLLWGYGGASALPGGSYTILSALASILLSRKESGRDEYISVLERHLLQERNPNVWKALLYRLGSAGATTPEVVSQFLRKLFNRFPRLLATREATIFLAYAQRWDDQLVFDLISDWGTSDEVMLRQAYGELVGLVATVKEKENWLHARDAIVASGSEESKIGLAHAAVNMWPDVNLRSRIARTLVDLLRGEASKELVATIMDVFRVSEELTPDSSTLALLMALAEPSTDLSAAPSNYVVESLQTLLPQEAGLVAAIAERLVNAWRSQLGDLRTGAITVAPQLTDLALTLHRIGGASRQAGVRIFEVMIEIDAYGARDTLAEIDGRFGRVPIVARRRLPRRRGIRERRLKST